MRLTDLRSGMRVIYQDKLCEVFDRRTASVILEEVEADESGKKKRHVVETFQHGVLRGVFKYDPGRVEFEQMMSKARREAKRMLSRRPVSPFE